MPHTESCLFSLIHALAEKMPDKAFWTLRYQGAHDELKSYLSGTDILLALIIMEVILWSQASQKGLGLWGCRKKKKREKYPCSFLRRKILDRDYKLTKVEGEKCLAVGCGKIQASLGGGRALFIGPLWGAGASHVLSLPVLLRPPPLYRWLWVRLLVCGITEIHTLAHLATKGTCPHRNDKAVNIFATGIRSVDTETLVLCISTSFILLCFIWNDLSTNSEPLISHPSLSHIIWPKNSTGFRSLMVSRQRWQITPQGHN